jgi:tripartite-type tricarboxylate transporter receptor subunit TctC
MQLHRRDLLAGSLGCLGSSGLGLPAAAQTDGLTKIIVAFPPGGGQDLVARLIARKLGDDTRQTVIVENNSGGAGFVGIMAVAKAKPDGRSLLINTMGMGINAAAYRNLPYDSTKDIEPVAIIGTTPYYIGISPTLPFTTMVEFIAAAKQKPGFYKGASFANSAGALTIELLRQQAKIDVATVPYRGVGPAAQAVISGEADFLMVDGASILPFIDSGRMKGVGVAAAQRTKERPNIPTLAEAGLSDMVIESWYGMFTRGGTSDDIAERLHDSLQKAILSPDVSEKLVNLGLQPRSMSRSEFKAMYNSEIDRWKGVVKKGNFALLD